MRKKCLPVFRGRLIKGISCERDQQVGIRCKQFRSGGKGQVQIGGVIGAQVFRKRQSKNP